MPSGLPVSLADDYKVVCEKLVANVTGGSRKLGLGGSMFWFCVFVTMAQCCIHTTEVHVTTLSLATAAAVAFGTVAFNSSVMGDGGSCVGSEMDLQAVLSPTDVCPSFAIRPGDAWSVCWVLVGEQYVTPWHATAVVAATFAFHIVSMTYSAGSPVASVHSGWSQGTLMGTQSHPLSSHTCLAANLNTTHPSACCHHCWSTWIVLLISGKIKTFVFCSLYVPVHQHAHACIFKLALIFCQLLKCLTLYYICAS